MIILAISLGAFVGALLRYWLQNLLNQPRGLWLANVLASLVFLIAIRIFKGTESTALAYALITVGFCGALSTWSSLAKLCHEMVSSKGLWKTYLYYLSMLAPIIIFAAGVR